jgi:hypothetical protein
MTDTLTIIRKPVEGPHAQCIRELLRFAANKLIDFVLHE